MGAPKHILVVDDDVDTCTLLSAFLGSKGFEVSQAFSAKSMMKSLKEKKIDLVLCDFRLGDADGLESISGIRKVDPTVPIIIITGYSSIRTAVNVIKSGAFDYVSKPLIPDEILHTVRRALESSKEAVQAGEMGMQDEKNGEDSTRNIIAGESRQAAELFRQIELVAPTNYNVIIYGESGSGKEVVARSIHSKSKRKNKPFIPLDCGAISRELAGSELFGHEKGSFTGALGLKIGHFELANGGTLFLDEVANLPFDVQSSLLRVVQEKKMKRIGGTQEIELDVRILVASNELLQEAFRKGKFREDLFHRFNEFSIQVPPLRERPDDLLLFARHFLYAANKELNKQIKNFDEDVLTCFRKYNWPGNVREMKNVVKRAALLCDEEFIRSKFLPLEISNPDKFMRSDTETHVHEAGHTDLKDATRGVEYETIVKVLEQVKYNKSAAAKLLNIDRKTLYNKMKAYNL